MSAALKIVEDESSVVDIKKNAAEITLYFVNQCGMKKLPWMAAEFEKLLNKGFEPDLLREIIDRTSRAPRPSWAYLSAITSKCTYYSAFTLFDFFNIPRNGEYEDTLQILKGY